MKMYLLDNGIDSLHMGIHLFEEFLTQKENAFELEQNSYLKLSLTSIQNAVEILSKEILSRVDELIIYKDQSNVILDALHSRNERGSKVPLYYLLINMDVKVVTISYSKTIDELSRFFKINSGVTSKLKTLGELRNKITHFGLNRELDFYRVIGAVNFAIDFTIWFFYPAYRFLELHPLDGIYERMIDVLELGHHAEVDYWSAVHHVNFIDINSLFRQACFNLNTETEKEYDIEFDNEGFADSPYFYVVVSDEIDYLATFSNENVPEWDLTILYHSDEEEDGTVYGYFDHCEEQLFEATQIIKVKALKYESDINKQAWLKRFKGSFRKTALNLESVTAMLKRFIVDSLAYYN